jgi:SAM-dependent methyltransferase
MSDEDVLGRQRETWERSAAGWHTWDDVVDRMLEPTRLAMLEQLRPESATHHLDVATGTGEPGLSVAEIARTGRVVLSDFADGMLDGVRRTVVDRGYAHVEVVQADASALPFDDSVFDSVSCRFGMMFFPDLDAAASEFARVLRPGGRVCVAVWAEPEHNQWAVIPQRELMTVVDLPPPPPDAPGVFRCARSGAVPEVFARAGLDVETESEVAITLRLESPETFWDFTAAVAAPVVAGLAITDERGREQIRSATIAAVRPHDDDGELRIPGLARVVTARRP